MNLKTLKVITLVLGVSFLVLLSLFIYMSVKEAAKDNRSGERSGGECTDTPQFEEYPAPTVKDMSAASSVNFESEPRGYMFKTAINEWFAKGVQSGSFYAVAEWGCGTSCQDHAIIDMRSGNITWFGLGSSYGIAYRSISNLIIINPLWNVRSDIGRVATTTTSYYELREGKPRLICTITNKPT